VWKRLVSLQELRAMSDDQITIEIDQLLRPSVSPVANLDSGDVTAAQFYMAELDRRERQRADRERDQIERERWRTDLKYEQWIVGLIVVEVILAIGLAIWGDHRQTQDVVQQIAAFKSMQAVLSHLDESSKATADAMKELRTTTEAMNQGIQTEVGLNYDPAIVMIYNEKYGALSLTNKSRTNILFYGAKAGDRSPYFLQREQSIPSGESYSEPIESFIRHSKPVDGMPGFFTATYLAFIKNKNGVQFIAESEVQLSSNPLALSVGPVTVRKADWSKLLHDNPPNSWKAPSTNP
jgi:hypothetical protein